MILGRFAVLKLTKVLRYRRKGLMFDHEGYAEVKKVLPKTHLRSSEAGVYVVTRMSNRHNGEPRFETKVTDEKWLPRFCDPKGLAWKPKKVTDAKWQP